MKTKIQSITAASILLLGLSALILPGSPGSGPRTLEERVTGILAAMPAQNLAEMELRLAELVQLGPDAVDVICRRIVPPATGGDAEARYALAGLAAARRTKPEGEAERKMISLAIGRALRKSPDREVGAFLIEQLQLVGLGESIPVLAVCLQDERLSAPAIRALEAIHSPAAERALLKALSAAPNHRLQAIIKALGDLSSIPASRRIGRYLESADSGLRQAAFYALANAGNPESAPLLSRALERAVPEEKIGLTSLQLLYARRLFESGDRKGAVAICRRQMSKARDSRNMNVNAAALSILVECLGSGAMPDLLAAMESENSEFRTAALQLTSLIPGKSATGQWLEELKRCSPAVRADIIAMLGMRNDRAALPAVLAELRSSDPSARRAAIPASCRLGGESSLEPLAELLLNGRDDEIELIRVALITLPPDRVNRELSVRFRRMPSGAKTAALEILSAHGSAANLGIIREGAKDSDARVRIGALLAFSYLAQEEDLPLLLDLLRQASRPEEYEAAQKAAAAAIRGISDPEKRAEPILSVLRETSGMMRIRFLELLPAAGSRRALQTVIDETKRQGIDARQQDAAIRILSAWPDAGAAAEIRRWFMESTDPSRRLATLRGYLRLTVTAEAGRNDPSGAIRTLNEMLAAGSDPEEKKAILASMPGLQTGDALKIGARYLGDAALKTDAALAVLGLALSLPEAELDRIGYETVAIISRANAIHDNPYLREQAGKLLETLASRREQEFIPLFNGRDLTGWKGLVDDPPARARMSATELLRRQDEADNEMRAHWKATDGVLTFDGKGRSICTGSDYEDFELLVDWKIEAGGDSGIYLRGSPQVQIWDSAKGPEGSGGLYNNQKNTGKPIVCADRPVGEWNTFWIRMTGERVTVYLNDVQVVDDVVMENYWQRDKPIFPVGQIELQAHNTPLYFRNIRIRDLRPEK